MSSSVPVLPRLVTPKLAGEPLVGNAAKLQKAAFYRPELDALRFCAFFLVFLHHAMPAGARLERFVGHGLGAKILDGLFLGGCYGVDLFFCLSSYLITTLLLKEDRLTGGIDVKSFYIRRVLRIWPLYFAFLVGVMPLAGLLLPQERLPVSFLGAYLLLSGNWACAAWGFPASPASVLWSVSIEEQFYLSWPIVMKRWIRHLPAICTALIVVSLATRAGLFYAGQPDASFFCNTLARLDPIAAGALIAYYLRGRTLTLRPFVRLSILFFGLAAVVVCGAAGARFGAAALWTYPLATMASVLLLLGSLGIDLSALPTWLRSALTKAGQISYGLYVFHALALALVAGLLHLGRARLSFWMFLVQTILTLALTFALAIVSYQFLESPFLSLKRRFTRVATGS